MFCLKFSYVAITLTSASSDTAGALEFAKLLHSREWELVEFFYNYSPSVNPASNAAAIEAGRGDSKLIHSLVAG